MSTTAEPLQTALEQLAKLRDAWPPSPWTWDDRFECVVSTIPIALVPTVEPILTNAFSAEWTTANVGSEPPPVRALARRCGDIRAGQKVFTADLPKDALLFGLWWPWGNGAMVSVRLGVANHDNKKELVPLVRTLFDIR